MRRGFAIAQATALEILSEPLSLLILLAALVLATLAPAFHYHQFGEATRMARDAGASALLMGSLVFAAFGVLRAMRAEIESGTLQMALAHPVSRTGFWLAKTFGAVVATLVFDLIVAANVLTIVRGAEIGGLVAAKSGDVARLWGPAFAAGVATLVVPLVVGAGLNRFLRCRFVLTSFVWAAGVALAGCALGFSPMLTRRLLPVLVCAVLPAFPILTAAAALAVRFRANQAVALLSVVLGVALPFLGNYYLPEALARGGCVPWTYVGLAAAALLPVLAAFGWLGARFMNGRDVA